MRQTEELQATLTEYNTLYTRQKQMIQSIQASQSRHHTREEVETAMRSIASAIANGRRLYWYGIVEMPGWFEAQLVYINRRNEEEYEYWHFYK